jgi:drug/metabolite transporter (DMT)-like permease
VSTEGVAVVALIASALVLGGDPRPRKRADLWGLAPGVMSSLALLCFILANRDGLLSIAAVITALYPAFTVLLAIGVLRERVHRIQAFGLLLCGATIVLVSLG